MKLKKMTLNINGADRMFICDPEQDTLADVIRRLGLTGTKVGCGVGVCGACSVILNGKVTRSCTKKIKSIKEYSKVVTIEGIGSPMHLHPLQVAFMNHGAVQCGFCSPGFIVSAYQLLQENPDPTREAIRDWFHKHRNLCRCTGYKQIVNAVMEAAKVMRGECDIEDIKQPMPDDKEYYGKALPRPAALGKVCGVTDYGDDIELKMPPETLHVVMVQPKVAHHAKVLKINTAEAEAMEGVYKVVTHKDIKGSNRLNMFTFLPWSTASEPTHVLLVEDKIVNYGDIVALVAADTKAHAIAAAEKVTIKYETLPAYTNYLEAAMPDAIRIHEDHPNVWSRQPVLKGAGYDTPQIFDDAPHVVEGRFYSSREPHMPIEGDTVQAYWGDDGLLTIHCKSQAVYTNLGDIAEATGLPEEKIRVIANPTGGCFGWGIAAATYAIAAIACLACDDKPIAFSMTYQQYMAFSGKRSPSYCNARMACDDAGKILAVEFDAGIDHGAYDELGDDIISPYARFLFFPYNVPNAIGVARVATTNHSYGTAYRGYGSPQAYTTSEALMDMMAEKLGMDPFEIRWNNIARPGDSNITSALFPNYPMEEMMEKLRPIYEKAVAEAKAKDRPEKRGGVGLAWGGYKVTEGAADECVVYLELREDGKFVKYDTWEDVGQGGDVGSLHCTLEALKPLGVTPDDIVLIQNDSKHCPNSGESAASRQHYMNGKAVVRAAEALMNAMRKPDSTYRTYQEMVDQGIPTKYEGMYANKEDDSVVEMDPNTGVGNPQPEYCYALFLAEVEVDTDTGKTTVIGMTCVDDVGVIGDIEALNGQAYGGMSHSIGFALTENYEDVTKHTDPLRGGVPTIKEIPDQFHVIHNTTYRTSNPFGSSGASEAYQSGGHMAVINAIKDACGVRIYELPASPEKVKAGIDALAAGKTIEPPKRYFLGTEFKEEMEYIRNNPK
ncbi:MAG: molybdopterin-dependent oxidoreductase [Firmicutes bacterium]|jgi:aldehyde oxidoreductase|nr:molybdopterin-dependent oxidoreductase [Bacillota bacterium]